MGTNLSNKDIYKGIFTFSVRRLIFGIICIVILGGLSTLGFLIANKLIEMNGAGLLGLGAGVVVAIIVILILSHFFMYVIEAGSIAVITEAVVTDKLPENPWEYGKSVVKSRFTTIAAYYAVTSVIKGLFHELGNAITNLGKNVGGDAGQTVGSVISTIINTVVAYLCDCCLGWVFYRKEIGAFKATCEGAVIFFKNGKTLLKNMGRIFGIAILSFLVIGGAFFGIFYAITIPFKDSVAILADEIMELAKDQEPNNVIEFLSKPETLAIAIAAVAAIIVWTVIHDTFVKPFTLVGVLRNYINAGIENIPAETEFDILEKHSKKFTKYKKKYANEM